MKKNTNKVQLSLLAVSLMAMPLVGYAISNPFAQASNTDTSSSSNNTATQSGLASAQNRTFGNLAPEGSGATPSYGTSNYSENTATESGDIQEAVENCEIVDAHKEAQINAVKIASITPNIDEIFNSASKQAEGCFASSKEIINLAIEIPNITSSWSGISALIQKRVQAIMQEKVNEVLDKGCKIAQGALHESMSPIIAYVDEFNANGKNASNSIFGNMQVGKDTPSYTLGDILGEMDLAFNKGSNTQALSRTVPNVASAANVSTFSAPTAASQPTTYGAYNNYQEYNDGSSVAEATPAAQPQQRQAPQQAQPQSQVQPQVQLQPQAQQPAPVAAPKPMTNSVAPNPYGNGG